jgi:hypothetical protein
LNKHAQQIMRERKKALKKENGFDEEAYKEFNLSIERALRRIERQAAHAGARATHE